MPLRVIFMGTPDFAVPTLTEIVGAGHEIAAVYTQPPRKAGRGMEPRPTPVAEAATRFGLAVRTPVSLKDDETLAAFQALNADIAVVVAYGLILPPAVLAAPAMGCLNLHASLLPRWRGAAPIHRAIMAGDNQTGVSIMRMQTGLDTGPVGMAERIAIGPDVTRTSLETSLARIGADLMHRALGAMERGALDFIPQPEAGVTYAAKIDKAEARIDWQRPASDIHNQVRGLSPFPGAWFEMALGGKPARIKVLGARLANGAGAPGTVLDDGLKIACGDGAIELSEVQRSGKKAVSGPEFLKGTGGLAGLVLKSGS